MFVRNYSTLKFSYALKQLIFLCECLDQCGIGEQQKNETKNKAELELKNIHEIKTSSTSIAMIGLIVRQKFSSREGYK